MFISRIKKPVSFLLMFAMVFSMVSLLPGYGVAEPGEAPQEPIISWDLSNFVHEVMMFDMSGGTPTLVGLGGDVLYPGSIYKIIVDFAETAERQLAYNQDDVLLYQLPSALQIPNAISETPIHYPDTSTVIGWYEIDTTGLVTVWFDDIQEDQGDQVQALEDGGLMPEVINFIDYYDNVSFTLAIVVELTEDPDSGLDFGNGVIIAMMIEEDEALAIEMADLLLPLAAGTSWDLSDFLTSVTMYDTSSGTPVEILPGGTTYIGNTYLFRIAFAETSQLQMEYTNSNPPFDDGRLIFQLPSDLTVPSAILQTPIYYPDTNAIIGWYTISTTGLVEVWFDNVDTNGNPTPGGVNFIDYYANVTLTLDIYAQLTGGSDGQLDFGNGIIVTIDPPIDPPPSLTMHKSSRYYPNTETIYYMITIMALGGPVTGINLNDAPEINGNTIVGNNAILGFTYQVNRVGMPPGTMEFMTVGWPTPSMFTYSFGTLVLNPGDFITIRYHLNIQQLIADNPMLVPSAMVYDFEIENLVAVNGTNVPPVQDNTVDHVRKVFPITKNGTLQTGDAILWEITIGDGVSTVLNGGTITDDLDANLAFPLATEINITYYDNGVNVWSGTLDMVPPSVFTANQFVFEVPASPAPIYQITIEYVTPVPTNLIPHPGMPSIVFENDVNITFPDGEGFDSGGRVPITTDTVAITKNTSGICGDPTNGYWVDYTITVYVPAGLMGQRLYLYDTLGILPGSASVPNTPIGLQITATDTTTTADLTVALYHTDPIVSGNTWRVYFGTTGTTIPAPAASEWQFNQAVTLTITYTIDLEVLMSATPGDTAISRLQNNMGSRLSNILYLINSYGDPSLGSLGNSVGSASVNDSWPIFKTGTPTADPALFNYVVTINGGYSDRLDASDNPIPLFRPGSNPSFTDTFDSRLMYVPDSFYIVDTISGDIFAPPSGLVVSGNTFTVNLNQLEQFDTTPELGGVSIGAVPDWFAQKHTFQVHYQLAVINPSPDTPILNIQNTASISVNPDACTFEANATVSYNPRKISKTMTPAAPGSARIHVDIVINPDGSTVFSDGTNPNPPLVTAKDVLTNMTFFTDTITIYTQTQVGGIWNGIWVEQPYIIGFNSSVAWSVNIIGQNEIDFVIPNRTPVRITYDALVTLGQDVTDTISNQISIFGEEAGDEQSDYTVGGAGIGVGAGRVNLTAFKRDYAGNLLSGAQFTLYVTDLSTGPPTYIPPYIPPANPPLPPRQINGTGGQVFNFAQIDQQTTDINGIATLSNQWLNSTNNLLFLLVEDVPPYGYVLNDPPYTFFTLNPAFTATDIAALQSALGYYINQTSDFVTVQNTPISAVANSLRIRKIFEGLTDAQVRQLLPDFEILVTTPLYPTVPVLVFDVEAALNPNGIILTDIASGVYIIDERNYGPPPGYTWTVSPGPLPIRPYVLPNPAGEVVILIRNIYTPITQPPPTRPPVPPFPPPEPSPTPTPSPPPTPTPSPIPTPSPTPSPTPIPSPTPTPPPGGGGGGNQGGGGNGGSPQTGDDRQIAIFIVLLITGLLCMGGTVVYAMRKKIFYQGKHL